MPAGSNSLLIPLYQMNAPKMLLAVVLLLQWADMPSLTFDCVELFAGVGNVSAAFRQHGKSVASFDQSYSESMHFTSAAGFILALWLVMSAGPGSLLLCAPPCSSWTRVSRGTTWRTRLNPLGLSYRFIEAANLTISRLTLILMVAECTHCCWILEQPMGSADTIPYHPRLDWFINQVIYVFRKDFWMLLWGGPCPKRTTVWSADGDIIQQLDLGVLTKETKESKRTLETTCSYQDGRGEKRFKGLPSLRESQTYPRELGDGLHDIMKTWQPQPHLRQKRKVDLNLSDRELFCSLPLNDLWSDADLVGAYRYLQSSKKSKIPLTWQPVFDELDAELAKVSPN